MAAAQLIAPMTIRDQLAQQLENLVPIEDAEPQAERIVLRLQALGRCWGA